MELAFLGPLEATGPFGPVLLRGTKERVLLALLAVRPNEVVSTANIIDGLWGDDPPPRASKGLHSHVAHVRRALEAAGEPECLLTRDPGYVLRVDPDVIDAVRFERHAEAGRRALGRGEAAHARQELATGLALWKGDALADCLSALVLQAEAVRLDELRKAALEDRIAADLQLGEDAALVAELELLIVGDPLRERLWHSLVLALYRSGRQGDALGAFQRARTTLVDQLGIEPGAELRRLEQAVLDGAPELDVVRPAAPVRVAEPRVSRSRLAAISASGPRFVGRRAELDLLIERWALAREGARQAVLVAGEPGIGKTRLGAELALAASADGAFVLHGRCDEGLAVPYQPFVEVLRDRTEAADDASLAAVLGPYANELVRLAPELAQRGLALAAPTQSDAATEQYRLFDAVCAWMAEESREQPVVLLLDDLHWAAPPTLLLLRHLVASDRPMRMLVIGTYRDSELADAPALVELLADLRRAPDVDRIELRGLDEEAVAAFVGDAPNGDIDFARAVHAHTGGNPFFVSEVVRNAAEAHADDIAIPAAAREVVARRLSRLSPVAQQALTTASVIGMEFRLPVLQEALDDVETTTLLAALDQALDARLVDELAPNRFGFAHAIIRGALHDELSRSRRLHLHARVGAAIETVLAGHLREHLPELASHYAEADPPKAVTYASDAAVAALDALAFEDAIKLSRLGLEAAERARTNGTPVAATQECDLHYSLGCAELRAGQKRGRTTLLRAYDIAQAAGDPRRQAHAVLAVNRGYFARIGRTDAELVSRLEAAIAAQPDGATVQLAELLATLASELVWASDGDRRFDLIRRAVTMARAAGDQRALARVLLRAIMTLPAPDTLEERLALYAELVPIADALQDPAIRFDAAFAHSTTAWEAGDIASTNLMEEIATALARALRQPRLAWQASFMRASRHILEGSLDEAERTSAQMYELGKEAGQESEAFIFSTEQLLEIRRWQDRLGELLDAFRDLAGQDGIDFGYALVRYLYDAGDTVNAVARYREIKARQPMPPRRDMLSITTLQNLGYVAHKVEDVEYAGAVYDLLLPFARSFTNTTVARPVSDHFLALLASTRGEPARATMHFERALDAHARACAPLLLAETQLEYARFLHANDGEEKCVRTLLDAVEATAASTGAALLQRRVVEVWSG